MIVTSKKREKFGWSQPDSWYNKTHIARRRAETMFELMIEDEIEKKLLHDIYTRRLEMQKLRSERHLLHKNGRDSLAMELRRLAAQPKNIQTAWMAQGESIVAKEHSWRRDRRYGSPTGRVKDEVWEHFSKIGGIPELPESPDLSPIDGTCTSSVENIGFQADCNNKEFVRGLMESCSLSDTGLFGKVQNFGLARGMTVTPRNHINVQSSSDKMENTHQDKKFNVDLIKTEICKSWSKFGECAYGESCWFAHGTNELRVRPKPHKNYKTEMCKKLLAGFCPYGSRCCFVHNPKEWQHAISGGYIVANGLQKAIANKDMIRRWHS